MKCDTCKYYDDDTGFCQIQMIIPSRNEICEYYEIKD